jgi:hypothetical protein
MAVSENCCVLRRAAVQSGASAECTACFGKTRCRSSDIADTTLTAQNRMRREKLTVTQIAFRSPQVHHSPAQTTDPVYTLMLLSSHLRPCLPNYSFLASAPPCPGCQTKECRVPLMHLHSETPPSCLYSALQCSLYLSAPYSMLL